METEHDSSVHWFAQHPPLIGCLSNYGIYKPEHVFEKKTCSIDGQTNLAKEQAIIVHIWSKNSFYKMIY